MAILRALRTGLGALLALALLVPALLAVLPLAAVAGLTRLLARRLEPEAAGWRGIIRFDPDVGWRLRSRLDCHCLGEPSGELFHVVTDEEGWRGPLRAGEAGMLVFGDSFAFGYGVSEKHGYWALAPELKIKPIGVPGYNMVQGLLHMRRMEETLRGRDVVWFVFVGNDVYDNGRPSMAGYTIPFVREEGGRWEIETGHLSPRNWLHNEDLEQRRHHEMLGHTYSLSPRGARAYRVCEYLLGEAQRLCARAGARLTVVTIPDLFELTVWGRDRLARYAADPESFDPELPHRMIGESCARLGIPYVSGQRYLGEADYNVGDRHWNERGNQAVARLLRDVRAGAGADAHPAVEKAPAVRLFARRGDAVEPAMTARVGRR